MRPKTYVIPERAIEEGFQRGYTRAFKHTDNPTEERVKEEVVNMIMGDICEVFKFDDDFEAPRCRKCNSPSGDVD